ncbi:MAG: hypothetical protein HYW45_03285 [Candidatus Daviesbacteria bacterium]|nr:MAG: hypothetical protein HYW45_03285 [Candidatus Daviesbacteria bacterium]
MDIFGFQLDKNIIANNWVPIALWAVTITVLKILWKWIKILWSKLILKLAKKLPKLDQLVKKILWFLSIFFTPQAKLIYLILAGLIFPFLIRQPYGFVLSVFVALVGWSLYSEVTRSKSIKNPIFSDSFENLDSWETISGKPKAEKGFGQPAPSILLPIVENDAGKHTVVELKELIFTNGIIELDVYLEQGSLIDLIFRGDIKAGKYYMARFDSRAGSGNHDGFFRNDGNGFNSIGQSSRNISPDSWHKMRVVISGDNFQLYDENGFIFSATDDRYKKGAVGIFNEVANVYVDNFSVKT